MDLLYTIISGIILLISFYQQIKIRSLENKIQTLSDGLINSYVIHSAIMKEIEKKENKKQEEKEANKILND